MSRRLRLLLLAAGLVAVVVVAGLVLLPRLAGNGGVNIPIGAAGPVELDLPPGFEASIVARDLGRPRFMAYDEQGVLFVADMSGGRVLARGLRNAVGLAINARSGELWATNNGRDWLGDDEPPETVYVVTDGMDAGWPRCHAGRIVDPDFGGEGACQGVATPAVEMQAHAAPLGLAFYDGDQFPAEYRGDLFVALHGSWNRSEPVGYKVVRIPLDETSSEDGRPAGQVLDFATGWLLDDGDTVPGRPAGVVVSPDGSLLVSDDKAGLIYRIRYRP